MELKFRKLKANEIDIRVGRVIDTDKFKGVSLLLYKDARVDMNILDETVGAMNWQRRHNRENANCEIGIFDTDKNQWVWKEDTGTESNTEAEKGLASDSFKRAGVNWGIGRELYSAKNIMVQCELANGKVKKGIEWEVEEIEYQENEISKLIIVETSYGKDKRVVYTFGNTDKTVKKPPKNPENKTEVLTLEKALTLEFEAKGKAYKLSDCTIEQLLYLKDHATDNLLKDGAQLILMDRARTGEVVD